MWFLLSSLISPKKFVNFFKCIEPWCVFFGLSFLAYGFIGGLWLTPSDYLQGDGFRIIYVHVPSAFLSLFIYVMMSIAAIVGLVWRMKMAHLVVKHSAPIGATFTFLALVTGSIWGKPMWGTWWIWDARLTSELILLFLYFGVILFQSATQDRLNSERLVAILVLIGSVDIPIIHYSVNWWNTLHQGPTLQLLSKSKIDPSMLYPLLAMIVAFLFYYVIVLFMRMSYELIVLEQKPHWLKG